MFDVGFWELTIIGVVALIIVGPERLPGLARTTGLWVGKARRMVADVKRDIDREIKASEMGELKEGLDSARKEVEKATDSVKRSTGVAEVSESLKSTFQEASPVGKELESELDEIDKVAKEMSDEITGQDKAVSTTATGATDEGPGKAPPSGN